RRQIEHVEVSRAQVRDRPQARVTRANPAGGRAVMDAAKGPGCGGDPRDGEDRGEDGGDPRLRRSHWWLVRWGIGQKESRLPRARTQGVFWLRYSEPEV